MKSSLGSMVVACVLVMSFAAASANAADTAKASGSSGDQAAQANNPLANLKTFNLHNYYIGELSGTDESANQFWLRYAQPLSTPLGSWLIRASLPVSRLPIGVVTSPLAAPRNDEERPCSCGKVEKSIEAGE